MEVKLYDILRFITAFLFFSCSQETTTQPEIIIPTCVITQPSEGTSFALGDTVEIQVNAIVEGGQVAQVKFFIDNQLKHSDFESPFNFLWDTSEETLGEHVIRAEAQDVDDATGLSSSISVALENLSPTCTISHPSNGDFFSRGETGKGLQLQRWEHQRAW